MSMVRFLVYCQPMGCRRPGGDDVRSPEEQGGRVAHPRNRRCVCEGARQPRVARAGFPERGCAARGHRRRPARFRNGGGRQGNGLRRFRTTDQGGRPQRCAAPVGAGVGRTRMCSRRRCGRCARRARRRSCSGSSRSCASIRSPIRTTAARGSARLFPNCSTSRARGVHAGGAYHYSTWSGISGDKFHGRFAGADFSIVDNPWLDEHIRSKGPLGRTTSAHQIHDGRRHAQLSQSHRQWLERSRTSGLGRLGRTLRVLHAAHAQVVSRTGNAAILVRRRR